MIVKLNRSKGFSMALAMCIIVLLAILGMSLLQLSASTRIGVIRQSQIIAAKCAADAGLTKAVYDIADAYKQGTLDLSNLPQLSEDLENCSAGFQYTVFRNAQGDIMVDSTGNSGIASRTVHCKVDVESTLFEHALFADNFTIKNNAYIDGYDSDLGDYGGLNQSITSIGTNNTSPGAIHLENVMDIEGDIVVGPTGDPADVIDKGLHVNITGDQSAAPEEKLTPIILPASLSYKGTSPFGTISESGTYDTVSSINGENITIEGDVILNITGNFKLDNNSTITINPGSSLKIYINGTFQLNNGAGINNLTKKPPQCQVFSTSSTTVTYDLDNNGDFYGALYAPNAIVNVSNNAVIYGAIVSDQLYIDNSSEIHGDSALRKGNYGDDYTKLVQGKWWE